MSTVYCKIIYVIAYEGLGRIFLKRTQHMISEVAGWIVHGIAELRRVDDTVTDEVSRLYCTGTQ